MQLAANSDCEPKITNAAAGTNGSFGACPTSSVLPVAIIALFLNIS